MSSVERWEPILRVSGVRGLGRGYCIPTRPGDYKKQFLAVPAVTAILGVLEKPGVLSWSIAKMAKYAAEHAQDLLNVTEEQAERRIMGKHYGEMKEANFDEPVDTLKSVPAEALNDAAELGSITHDWINDFTTNQFDMMELTRDEQAQMVSAFLDWWEANDVEVVLTEGTVLGNGYSGTFDWLWRINGVLTLGDTKTARSLRDENIGQLAALGAAESLMVQTTVDDPDGVEYDCDKWGKTYWKEEPVPDFSQYAVLHLRPAEFRDGEWRDAFCELHVVPDEMIDVGWDLFQGALKASNAQRAMKKAKKEVGWE